MESGTLKMLGSTQLLRVLRSCEYPSLGAIAPRHENSIITIRENYLLSFITHPRPNRSRPIRYRPRTTSLPEQHAKRPRSVRLPSHPPPRSTFSSRSKVKGNRVVFGSGVSIGSGTVVLPSAHMSPEAHVGDNRVVGALATSAHPTRRNRYEANHRLHTAGG